MFGRVLVANRGEVACRIMRTLHDLEVEAVAVYSDADRGAPHVELADRAVRLGPGPPNESYLDAGRVLSAALETGAEAIHPGYGFLAEDAAFAGEVEAAGLAFIGPTPSQIATFGQKHVARERASQAGVPLLPGSALVDDLDAAVVAAEKVGFPVMIKASAGGGGIGMRVCSGPDEVADAFASVARLAVANFGSGAVFVERYLPSARHVEAQVFGDGTGAVLSLGLRDCSLQRRNQKLVEEAPPPRLADGITEVIVAEARKLAEAVSYRSAGTVEMLLDTVTGEHYFLETNTRLQVEHGVTELVYGVDLVAWMVRLAAGDASMFDVETAGVAQAQGHAIEARVYAENPVRDHQPSVGTLTHVQLPELDGVRLDSGVVAGSEVSPFYDPLLVKVLAHGPDRETALARLRSALGGVRLDGVETNAGYLQAAVDDERFVAGDVCTGMLAGVAFQPRAIEVLGDAGGETIVVAYPGRQGYWSVGVPPSGPMDDWSFRLGNRLLGNPEDAAGMECVVAGPTLRFHRAATICLAGAPADATLEVPGGGQEPSEVHVPWWEVVEVPAGATLRLGRVTGPGARSYVLVRGGIDVPEVLGSCTTFTLGGFGGYAGRPLRDGDLLRLGDAPETSVPALGTREVPDSLRPRLTRLWELAVLDGPHAAPDYLTEADVALLYSAEWQVHYHSARTGVRLVGPRLTWARSDGGDAGLHPSNIHDNPYAVGTVDFTGDMPVILGPDGPSLGGFVCPATVVDADLWKLGQLRAGDTVRLVPVSAGAAAEARRAQQVLLSELRGTPYSLPLRPGAPDVVLGRGAQADGRGAQARGASGNPDLTFRRSGDRHLLVEIGPPVLDLELRARAQQMLEWFQQEAPTGLLDLTPGIRSLQIQVDGDRLTVGRAAELVERADAELPPVTEVVLPSRTVWLPLSWDDPATRQAIETYQRVVRPDAPWCPSNLEFIRRINGLGSIDEVREIVFGAEYAVYGLGDVYLGAPVATPLDPRHRLVTTKYNPARTWTPENAVGIGGAYLCVYGMEGPGGYQFVGRTTQVWQRWPRSGREPWLLHHFDRLRFYSVSANELMELRAGCAAGRWQPEIADGTLSVAEHLRFLSSIESSVRDFRARQQAAFAAERSAWEASGELAAAEAAEADLMATTAATDTVAVLEGTQALTAPLTARVWSVLVAEGDTVSEGDEVAVLEAMKTEITMRAPANGKVVSLHCRPGDMVGAGQILAVVDPGHASKR